MLTTCAAQDAEVGLGSFRMEGRTGTPSISVPPPNLMLSFSEHFLFIAHPEGLQCMSAHSILQSAERSLNRSKGAAIAVFAALGDVSILLIKLLTFHMLRHAT